MEIKDLIDGHTFMSEENVIIKLTQTRDRLHKLTGFLKGLQYHKDKNIDCNWEYDFNFLCDMIDKFISVQKSEVKK